MRGKADPSISVADIQVCLESWLENQRTRCVAGLFKVWRRVTPKTAPVASDTRLKIRHVARFFQWRLRFFSEKNNEL